MPETAFPCLQRGEGRLQLVKNKLDFSILGLCRGPGWWPGIQPGPGTSSKQEAGGSVGFVGEISLRGSSRGLGAGFRLFWGHPEQPDPTQKGLSLQTHEEGRM